MIYIYSNIQPEKLLHVVVSKEDFTDSRKDVISNNEFLQLAVMKFEKGKSFKPHRHIWKEHTTKKWITQEAWIVVSGSVKCIYYDLNNEIRTEIILHSGEISITLEGGHKYELLEDSYIAEIKGGPYFGVENDKVFID